MSEHVSEEEEGLASLAKVGVASYERIEQESARPLGGCEEEMAIGDEEGMDLLDLDWLCGTTLEESK